MKAALYKADSKIQRENSIPQTGKKVKSIHINTHAYIERENEREHLHI